MSGSILVGVWSLNEDIFYHQLSAQHGSAEYLSADKKRPRLRHAETASIIKKLQPKKTTPVRSQRVAVVPASFQLAYISQVSADAVNKCRSETFTHLHSLSVVPYNISTMPCYNNNLVLIRSNLKLSKACSTFAA